MLYRSGDVLLNKYQIERLLGQGVFGEVYQATHIGLNVSRALKVLRKDMPGVGSTSFALFEQRCRLEVQLGARINHPHVVQVYDLEQEDGALILVMEYLPGGSLAERIEKARQAGSPISIDEAVQITRDIAAGLAALHSLDAVHRDLKPSNILFNAQGRAKVADLGLAQLPGGPSLRSKLSQPEPHPGTPTYMSPEQSHSTDYLTFSSDVYALGLILFEILTLRAYFHQQSGVKLRKLRPDAPAWLEELLENMLSVDPHKRPVDGGAVAAALQKTPIKKHRSIGWWIAGGLLFICLVLGVLALLLNQPAEESAQKTILITLPTPKPSPEIISSPESQALAISEATEETGALGLTPSSVFTPTPSSTPHPTIETTLQPRYFNVRFCDRPCDQPGAKIVESYPERVKYIYLAWDYEGFYPDMNYMRVWLNNGEEWVHYKCTWQGPDAGGFTLTLWDVDGLRSGTWSLEMYIEGQIAALAKVDVQGSYDFWEPAGHPVCPDF